MKHLGLFEGIGGFSLAARWMGWDTIAWCEINPFCQKVLKQHFPNATGHEDIRATDFTIYRGRVDILTGGFPYQPFSTAGKQLGTEDDRHLWPEMLRAIREIRPRYIVGENVGGILTWSGGMVFEQVHTDLEAEGYEVQAVVLPACSIGAPHRRDRVWFIAYANEHYDLRRPAENERSSGTERIQERHEVREPIIANSIQRGRVSANANSNGLQGYFSKPPTSRHVERYFAPSRWEDCLPTSILLGVDDGVPARVDRTKALGNAIVPQVAHQIFQAIDQFNHIQ